MTSSRANMQQTYDLLLNFVRKEREQLEADKSNYFDLVFGEILKYYEYLSIILPRYVAISEEFVHASEDRMARRMAAGEGSRELTRDELMGLEELRQQQSQLHLELESIFIFTSVLLDRISAATQYYFGSAKGQWRSFQAMKDHIEGYRDNKGLAPLPNEFLNRANWLHKNVCEFRHLLVVHKHEKDFQVRLSFGTSYSNDDNEAYFNLGLMYPQGNEEPFVSVKPSEILANLNPFIAQWVGYLTSNRLKQNLSPNA